MTKLPTHCELCDVSPDEDCPLCELSGEPDPRRKCDYPACDCPISFPEGHKPSVATEYPR